jgi:hypothetical protein
MKNQHYKLHQLLTLLVQKDYVLISLSGIANLHKFHSVKRKVLENYVLTLMFMIIKELEVFHMLQQ